MIGCARRGASATWPPVQILGLVRVRERDIVQKGLLPAYPPSRELPAHPDTRGDRKLRFHHAAGVIRARIGFPTPSGCSPERSSRVPGISRSGYDESHDGPVSRPVDIDSVPAVAEAPRRPIRATRGGRPRVGQARHLHACPQWVPETHRLSEWQTGLVGRPRGGRPARTLLSDRFGCPTTHDPPTSSTKDGRTFVVRAPAANRPGPTARAAAVRTARSAIGGAALPSPASPGPSRSGSRGHGRAR